MIMYSTAKVEIFMVRIKAMTSYYKVNLNKIRAAELQGFQPKFVILEKK